MGMRNRVNSQTVHDNYSNHMKFKGYMSNRAKLKSSNPLAIFDHLLQFRGDLAWAPENSPLKKVISLLLDSFEGQPSDLVDRFRHEKSILYRMSSLEFVSNHLREHFCSDTFSQALELDYRNFKL